MPDEGPLSGFELDLDPPVRELHNRAAAFPYSSIISNPNTIARLVTSLVPTEKLAAIGRAMVLGSDYIAQHDTFAGIPGALSNARARILALADPTSRAQGLEILSRLREFDEDSQSAVLAILSGPNVQENLDNLQAMLGLRGGLGPGAIAKDVGAAVAAPFVGGGWALSRGVDALQAGVERVPGGTVISQGLEQAQRGVGFAVREGIEPGFQYLINSAEYLTALPWEVSNAAFGIGRTEGESFIDQLERYAPKWKATERGPWVRTAADLAGISMDDPAYQGWFDLLDLAGALYVGQAIFSQAGAIKAARATPLEVGALSGRGLLGRAFVRAQQRGVEEFIHAKPGRALLAEIEKVHQKYPGGQFKGALFDHFNNIAPQLAEALSRETDIAGWSRAFARHVDDIPSIGRIGTVAGELRRVNENIKALAAGERGVADLEVLRARSYSLQSRLNDLHFKQPQFEWPEPTLVRAILHDTPVTRVEHILNAVVGAKGLNLQRLVNDLPRFPKMYMPFSKDAPADWAMQNAVTVTRILRITKTPPATIRAILGKMTEFRTRGDFYAWMESIADAIEAGVTKGGKRPIDPLLLEQITTFFRNPELERVRSPVHDQVTMPNGTTRPHMRNVLERQIGPDEWVAVPSQPNEFISGFSLPDIELMRDATSTLHRMDTFLRTRRIGNLRVGKWAMTPFDVARTVLNISTMIGKPLILVPRLIAMAMRIGGEEMLRNIGFGFKPLAIVERLRARGWTFLPGGTPIRISLKEGLPAEGVSALGLILPEATEFGMTRFQHPVYTAEWRTGVRDLNLDAAVAEEIARGLYAGIRHLSEDWLVKELVKRGPEETLAWLEADATTRHGFWYANDMRPHLEELGADPLTWLKDKMRQVDEITGGNALLKDGIVTKKWHRPGQLGALDVLSGRAGEGFRAETYTRLQAELSDLTEAWYAARRPGGSAEARAELAARRADILEHLSGLETETASRMYISLDNEYAVTGEILNAIRAGEFELPPTVMVDRVGSIRGAAALRGVRAINDVAARISSQLYRGFWPLTKVEVAGTRGSLYFQVLNRTYEGLVEAGWSPAKAFESAQARAGFMTKDIMYDLSARTSAQRALKDVFWFLPAMQEVLTTWLIKIPSRGYWPLGIGYLANRVDVVMDLFKEVGVIKTMTLSSGDQQDYVTVPGIATLVEKLTGRKVPDLTFFKPTGLNLVLSGLPGLSPPTGFVVGQAARDRGGIFKTISDWFQPFGPEVAWAPAALNYGYETLTGEPPPWELLSSSYQQQIFDRAWDQALQYAYSGLVADDNPTPRIETYADQTDPLTGNPSLSAEAEALYRGDLETWYKDWFSGADDYFRGVAFVRMLGASVTPAALYTTSEERQAWIEFYQSQVIPAEYDPDGSYSEAQRSMIAEYLDEHPGSLAFSTGYTVLGDQQRDLPYRSTGEDAFFDKLYTGELRVLAGKPDLSHQEFASEYMRRVAEVESYRYYSGQLNVALQDYGTTASAQLRNAYKVQQAVADYHFQWERYLDMNPDVAADIKKNRRRWAEEYGIPVRTFEVQREAELLQLMTQAAPFFTGAGGLRSGDYRTIRGQLAQLYSENGVFGPPNTAIEKQKAAFFDEVLGPYMDTVGPLYDQAADLQARGLYAGDIYDRIRMINERYRKRADIVLKTSFPRPEGQTIQDWGSDIVRTYAPDIGRLLGIPVPPDIRVEVADTLRGPLGTWDGETIRLDGEWLLETAPNDAGLVIHELTHAIMGPTGATPEWLREGFADYVRDQLGFATEKSRPHGGETTGGYQATARFLIWLDQTHPGAVARVASALTSGPYSDAIWEAATGENLSVLQDAYRAKPAVTKVPTPEQYFWGNQTEGERAKSVVAWTTRPQAWLTTFQMKQVGYPQFEGRDDLLATISTIEAQYHKAAAKVPPSSREADALKALRLRVLNQAALPYGDQGARLVVLYDGPPVARLVEFDYGAGNDNWQNMVRAVVAATDRIKAEDLSPTSYSQLALALKTHIEGAIELLRDPNNPNYDREFDRLWTRLGRAVPLKGYDYREGVLLYEAILFDQFTPAFVSDALINAVES